MTPITEFNEALRLILGDRDAFNVFQYSNETLASAVTTVFRCGRGPAGYALSGGNITPDVPDGNVFAIVVYESALMLIGGEDDIESYRTRALAVKRSGARRRDLLTELRLKIYEIRDGKDGFVSSQSFIAWAHGLYDILEHVEMQVDAPLASVTLTGSGTVAKSITL